jgi:sugar O-acyltransferase (sialic acid O-acetyltransferase NeuD family)
LLIYGASGHGKVVADAALAAGWDVLGFVDDDPSKPGSMLLGLQVSAASGERLHASDVSVVIGVGSNLARRAIYHRLVEAGVSIATVIHPRAVIAPSATIRPGAVVFAGAVINPDCVIGENSIVNTAASLDHDCVLGAHAHLSPGVHLGGTVLIGEGTPLGVGVSCRNNIQIGSWSVVGVGAAVVADLPDRVMAVGVPARVVRRLEP